MTTRMLMPALRDCTILSYRGRTILSNNHEEMVRILPVEYHSCIERESVRVPEMAGEFMSQFRGNRRSNQEYITVQTGSITRGPDGTDPEVYYRAILNWVTAPDARTFMDAVIHVNRERLDAARAEYDTRNRQQFFDSQDFLSRVGIAEEREVHTYNHRGDRITRRMEIIDRTPEVTLVSPLTLPEGSSVSSLREQLERLLAERMLVPTENLLNQAESLIVGHHRQQALEEVRSRLASLTPPKAEIDFSKRVIRRRRN